MDFLSKLMQWLSELVHWLPGGKHHEDISKELIVPDFVHWAAVGCLLFTTCWTIPKLIYCFLGRSRLINDKWEVSGPQLKTHLPARSPYWFVPVHATIGVLLCLYLVFFLTNWIDKDYYFVHKWILLGIVMMHYGVVIRSIENIATIHPILATFFNLCAIVVGLASTLAFCWTEWKVFLYPLTFIGAFSGTVFEFIGDFRGCIFNKNYLVSYKNEKGIPQVQQDKDVMKQKNL
jgi:hypothetical protein